MAICGECDFCGVDPARLEREARLAALRDCLYQAKNELDRDEFIKWLERTIKNEEDR